VTGATAGIGLETARGLAKMGAHVVIVGRSEDKTAATVAEIRRTTGSEKIEALIGDLSIMAEVRSVAAAFQAKYDRLDVLVNNVGAIMNKRKVTAEGVEMTWALNHLGYFVMTRELLDMLKDSAPARIVNLSSDAHKGGKIRWSDPEMSSSYISFASYAQSKLANVLFTKELARRLEGTGVTANAVHPGVVASNFALTNNGDNFIVKLGRRLFDIFSISVEDGAKTSLYVATSPEVEGVNGEYFAKSKIATPSSAARDESAQKRLWEITEARLAEIEQQRETA
jgi:NAD(P)-dependent dehydrogenase (short-subunit alcohol dehydrogenase family)